MKYQIQELSDLKRQEKMQELTEELLETSATAQALLEALDR